MLHVHDNLRLYVMREDVHSYTTRHKSQIDITRYRLSKSQDFSPVLALTLSNILPIQAKLLVGKACKCVARDRLLAATYYSIEVFLTDPLLDGFGCAIPWNAACISSHLASNS